MAYSNLESFLSCTTPRVPSQILPKTCIKNLNYDWQPRGTDTVEYFNLGDLWESYAEWSAYGAGAPIDDCGKNIVQYYTPYLSGIQIYTAKNISLREDCDGDFDLKSWSSESGGKLSRSSSNNSDRTWDTEDLSNNIEGCWSVKDRLGELYFEYFEQDVPFGRIPFKDKIDELSNKYPRLKSFYSADLAPASWMAVAWYPIYHIPAHKHTKDFYVSFLTYHTLSSSVQDDIFGDDTNETCCTEVGKRKVEFKGESISISLPPFGLAAYRMQPKVWLSEPVDQERFSSLTSAADSWLKQLQVHHHDYDFFISRPM